MIRVFLHVSSKRGNGKTGKRGDHMKSTGMIRKIDELGRVSIPIELRRALEMKEKDSLEIFREESRIVLRIYRPMKRCVVTGEVDDNHMSLANGKITLSPEGAKQLIEPLQAYLHQRTEEGDVKK